MFNIADDWIQIKATALPTEPQPLPTQSCVIKNAELNFLSIFLQNELKTFNKLLFKKSSLLNH